MCQIYHSNALNLPACKRNYTKVWFTKCWISQYVQHKHSNSFQVER